MVGSRGIRLALAALTIAAVAAQLGAAAAIQHSSSQLQILGSGIRNDEGRAAAWSTFGRATQIETSNTGAGQTEKQSDVASGELEHLREHSLGAKKLGQKDSAASFDRHHWPYHSTTQPSHHHMSLHQQELALPSHSGSSSLGLSALGKPTATRISPCPAGKRASLAEPCSETDGGQQAADADAAVRSSVAAAAIGYSAADGVDRGGMSARQLLAQQQPAKSIVAADGRRYSVYKQAATHRAFLDFCLGLPGQEPAPYRKPASSSDASVPALDALCGSTYSCWTAQPTEGGRCRYRPAGKASSTKLANCNAVHAYVCRTTQRVSGGGGTPKRTSKPGVTPKPTSKPGVTPKPTKAPGTPPGLSTKKGGAIIAALPNMESAILDMCVSWVYSWDPSPIFRGISVPQGVQYVPMIWSGAQATPQNLELAKQSSSGVLLGFNEPERKDQSQTTVAEALRLWPSLMATGLRLGSPVIAYDTLTSRSWLVQFMTGAKQRGYRVDFIVAHWFGGDFDTTRSLRALQRYLEGIHKYYGLPIWLKEYALIRWVPTIKFPTMAVQAEFARKSAVLLDSLPYVERYSWFAFNRLSLVNPTVNRTKETNYLFYDNGTATALGKAYAKISPARIDSPKSTPKPTTAPGGLSIKKGGAIIAALPNMESAIVSMRVSWVYSWDPSPTFRGISVPQGVQYVPMIWSGALATPQNLELARQSGSGVMLGFNQPDLPGESQTSVLDALRLWPALMATGMRLGSPVVSYDDLSPGSWLVQFMTNAKQRGYRVDFITVNWFGADFDVTSSLKALQGYLEGIHKYYGLPIWLKEYALIRWSPSIEFPSMAVQVEFARKSAALLNSLPYVERYSWFAFNRLSLVNSGIDRKKETNYLFYDNGTATALGKAYAAI